jgi:hypothetical protein
MDLQGKDILRNYKQFWSILNLLSSHKFSKISTPWKHSFNDLHLLFPVQESEEGKGMTWNWLDCRSWMMMGRWCNLICLLTNPSFKRSSIHTVRTRKQKKTLPFPALP